LYRDDYSIFNRSVNWDLLRCFLMVAREGSLSGAATRLGISQPTVGRRIAELERSTKSSLFVKSGKGYRLTPAGDRLVPQARAVEHLLSEWAQIGTDDDLAGLVRISAGEWLTHLIASNAGSLLSDLPDVQLHLSTSLKFTDLDDGTVDIALRNKSPETLHWITRRLGSMRHAVYGASKLVRDHRIDEANYAQYPRWVVLSRETGVQRSAAWFRRATGRDRASVTCSSSRAVLAAVSGGAGLALLPQFIGDETPGLRRVAATTESWDTIMVLHPDRRKVRRIREVSALIARLVEEALRRDRP
jgi:DNA-binding transcriptional LysR family regulator